MRTIKVGILGATGSVGQRFVQLLEGHPWFKIAGLFASERSAGRKYSEVAKWFLPVGMNDDVASMDVKLVDEASKTADVDILFSALPSSVAGKIEGECAKAGYIVTSNTSTYRMEKDVPLLIPEVNADHLKLVEMQKKRGWDGFIVTNPNCSAIMMTLTLKPLMKFGIDEVHVATMQAVSGAGYAGVPSMGIIDNVIPFIEREEDKMEREPLKILGRLKEEEGNIEIENAPLRISASCHRVPVLDGHTEAIWVKFKDRNVDVDDVKDAFMEFKSDLNTPFSVERPLIVREEVDRPQPRLDREAGRGMSVSIGRIRSKDKGEVKYIALGHNTIRGAAGASILNAELLVREKYVQ